jgi:hypothetical protein
MGSEVITIWLYNKRVPEYLDDPDLPTPHQSQDVIRRHAPNSAPHTSSLYVFDPENRMLPRLEGKREEWYGHFPKTEPRRSVTSHQKFDRGKLLCCLKIEIRAGVYRMLPVHQVVYFNVRRMTFLR